jgi:hypothetical protein
LCRCTALDEFVVETWAPVHAVTVSPRTRRGYASLYDHHIGPYLGGVALRDLRPELIARWQADRLAAGGGPMAVAKALTLLGNILQRAVETERIATTRHATCAAPGSRGARRSSRSLRRRSK